jgi:putative transposase
VKAAVHRVVKDTFKTTTVSKNACGYYFASILTDNGLPEAKAITHFERSRIIGIDMGIKDVVINSRGRKSGNPRFLSGMLKRLRRHQRAYSHKIEAVKKRYEAAKAACEGRAGIQAARLLRCKQRQGAFAPGETASAHGERAHKLATQAVSATR